MSYIYNHLIHKHISRNPFKDEYQEQEADVEILCHNGSIVVSVFSVKNHNKIKIYISLLLTINEIYIKKRLFTKLCAFKKLNSAIAGPLF